MRRQRQWAEMDASLIFSDEEILREAARSAEDPTWDSSAVPLRRQKRFFWKKVCEFFKGEVCFCTETFLSILTVVVVVEGEASAVVCDMIFSSQPCHKLIICTQSSASDSGPQTLKWLIWPHKARLPLCLTTFYVLSSASISDSCRCTIMSPPYTGMMVAPQCMSECVFQLIMLLRGNGRRMRRGRISRRKRKSAEGDGCLTIKSEDYSLFPISTMGSCTITFPHLLFPRCTWPESQPLSGSIPFRQTSKDKT